MKKTKFSESQIVNILKEAEAGVSLEELSRQHGFSKATFYKWKAKFGGMDVSEAKKLRSLEEENRKLKQLVADLSLDKQALAHAFRVFFGWSEPPEGGLAFDNLTPGDFAQVYSRADMLGATGDKAQVVEMLGQVSRTKPGAGAGLGFVR